MPEIVLRIMYDVGLLTGNRVRHPMERWRKAKAAKTAAFLAYRQAGSPELTDPIVLSYVIRRGSALDDDNALAGAKELRDMLCNRKRNGFGLVPDDSPAWVEQGGVVQETGGKWRHFPEVEVRVEARR